MEIVKASRKKKGIESKGYVMSGFKSNDYNDWFERWYPTREKAEAFANKKGWPIV